MRIRNLCAEEDTAYTYDTNARLSRLLTKTTGSNVTKYVYGLGLIGEQTGSTFRTYHFDCRGSTVAITDANGIITDTFAYDTYGKLISRTGTSAVIFGYNGRDGVVTDTNGLIYMRARYYSPDMKRFVNADVIAGQISNAITLNRYAYANGNPVSFVDPFGLFVGWLKDKYNAVKDWVVDAYNDAKSWIVDTYNDAKDFVVDTYNSAKDWITSTYNDVKDAAESAIAWIDSNVVKPAGNVLFNAGIQLMDGLSNIVNAIMDNVGFYASIGKEKTLNHQYYYLATYEDGIGYNKSFGNEKPITFFISAGENLWEFWEWSIGIDVNINGYGAGLSTGPQASLNIHMDNVSHEIGTSVPGRIFYKVAYNAGDGYIYTKYSLNGPETAVVVASLAIAGAYSGGTIFFPAFMH